MNDSSTVSIQPRNAIFTMFAMTYVGRTDSITFSNPGDLFHSCRRIFFSFGQIVNQQLLFGLFRRLLKKTTNIAVISPQYDHLTRSFDRFGP